MKTRQTCMAYCAKCDFPWKGDRQWRKHNPTRCASPGCNSAEWSLSPRARVAELVESNMRLVPWTIDRKILPRIRRATLFAIGGVEELQSVASLALLKAAQKFDPQFGAKFSTYAVKSISRFVWRHVFTKTPREMTFAGLPEDDARMATIADHRQDGAELVDARDLAETLLPQLTPLRRQAVELCVMQGMAARDVRGEMDLSHTRVYVLRKEALESMAKACHGWHTERLR